MGPAVGVAAAAEAARRDGDEILILEGEDGIGIPLVASSARAASSCDSREVTRWVRWLRARGERSLVFWRGLCGFLLNLGFCTRWVSGFVGEAEAERFRVGVLLVGRGVALLEVLEVSWFMGVCGRCGCGFLVVSLDLCLRNPEKSRLDFCCVAC